MPNGIALDPRLYVTEPMRRLRLRGHITRPWWVRRFGAFGENTVLEKPTWLYGTKKIEIGRDTLIFRGAMLSVNRDAWDRPGPALTIGNLCVIGRFVTLTAAESIIVEDNVGIGAYSTVLDNDHLHDGPSPNIFYNDVVTEPVRIGEGTWIAERCAVLKGTNIGRWCTIGANSVVRGDIPDYSIAVGAPARVVGSNRDAAEQAMRA